MRVWAMAQTVCVRLDAIDADQTVCVLLDAIDAERLAAIASDRSRPLKHTQRASIVLLSAERLSVPT